jgi:hypothetical protein
MNRVLLVLFSGLLLSSCHVNNRLYNPYTPGVIQGPSTVPSSIVSVVPNGNRTDRVDPDCDPAAHPCVAFLEFDEMGEMWDPGQLPAALKLIKKAKSGSKPPIVATFVHGWKNNADNRTGRQNGNLVGFEGVLEFLKSQGKYREFPMVGIFISWRGDLTKAVWPVSRQLTYFNREGTAIRIPGASMTGALTQTMLESHKDPPGAHVIMVGHSFGGLILERALSQAMADYVLRQRPGAARGNSGEGAWADLVVFVNSAAAASEGKQMFDLLKGLQYQVPGTVEPQDPRGRTRPLFLSISSLGDVATRFGLPVGHGFPFLGMKMNGSWRSYPPNSGGPPGITAQSSYYLSTTAHMEALQSHLIVNADDANDLKRCQDASGKPPVYFGSVITAIPGDLKFRICEKPGRWNDTPYWAMQMPAAIVPDHSGIFNTRFLGLLDAFLLDEQEMADPGRRPTLRAK